MFQFANENFLYLLFLIPLFVVFHIYTTHRRNKQIEKLGDVALVEQLMPYKSVKKEHFKFYIMLVALMFCILLLSRPQFGAKEEIIKRSGIETIIALDISNSMMAEDISPNRLERAKQMILRLVDEMHDDKVGLIVFAGDAYFQIPLTSDYISTKMFMPQISPKLISTQGTAIGTAIDMASSALKMGKEECGKTIVVFTDGENHEDDAVEAALKATKQGIMVNIVGMGTSSGAPIPIEGTMSFKKDRNGETVISKLNEQMCTEIAKVGNGVYVRADNSNKAEKVVIKKLDTLAKSEVESKVYTEYDEQFQIIAWVVLVLIVVELFVIEKKSKWWNDFKMFRK